MLRARLTFDQLLGSNGEYHEGDKAAVRTTSGNFSCSAICGNHVMRAGKHWVTFTSSHSFKDRQNIGLVRPPPGWDDRGLDVFSPAIYYQLQADLLLERTDRWDGDVNFCYFYIGDGFFLLVGLDRRISADEHTMGWSRDCKTIYRCWILFRSDADLEGPSDGSIFSTIVSSVVYDISCASFLRTNALTN
mmetsp:Transcript_34803/g.78132  ORF Transcript_34803/g.78132 Transcript_34803/m.78132 type:complete len:190 (+) Transcript_34803:2-571(+)